MKTILYITELLPYPLTSGGRIKTIQTIRTLSKKYTVHVVCQTKNREEEKNIRYLVNKRISVKSFYNPTQNKQAARLAYRYALRIPVYVSRYRHYSMLQYIETYIQENSPNIIHIDHMCMAQYLPKHTKSVLVYEEHNIESSLKLSQFLCTPGLFKKTFLFFETVLTYMYEARMLGRFDFILAISSLDRDRLLRIYKATPPIIVTPPVVRQNKVYGDRNINSILFIGSLLWEPNTHAVLWFCEKVLPLVHKKIPNLVVDIIGEKNPWLHMRYVRGVRLHGFVSDIRKFLLQAGVFVLPFWMGDGVRIKALTAMSFGVPVVSTPLGVSGLLIKSGREALIARDAEQFAAHIISVLTDKSLSKGLTSAASKYITSEHAEGKSAQMLYAYYNHANDAVAFPHHTQGHCAV